MNDFFLFTPVMVEGDETTKSYEKPQDEGRDDYSTRNVPKFAMQDYQTFIPNVFTFENEDIHTPQKRSRKLDKADLSFKESSMQSIGACEKQAKYAPQTPMQSKRQRQRVFSDALNVAHQSFVTPPREVQDRSYLGTPPAPRKIDNIYIRNRKRIKIEKRPFCSRTLLENEEMENKQEIIIHLNNFME